MANVEMACKELTKDVATNESREPQHNFLRQVVSKADEMC
jgi:hypothetical protein